MTRKQELEYKAESLYYLLCGYREYYNPKNDAKIKDLDSELKKTLDELERLERR